MARDGTTAGLHGGSAVPDLDGGVLVDSLACCPSRHPTESCSRRCCSPAWDCLPPSPCPCHARWRQCASTDGEPTAYCAPGAVDERRRQYAQSPRNLPSTRQPIASVVRLHSLYASRRKPPADVPGSAPDSDRTNAGTHRLRSTATARFAATWRPAPAS